MTQCVKTEKCNGDMCPKYFNCPLDEGRNEEEHYLTADEIYGSVDFVLFLEC